MKADLHTTTIKIDGMHCASCDILVKTKVEQMKHIVKVESDFHRKIATITHHGTLSLADINAVLCEYGYTVRSLDEASIPQAGVSKNSLRETFVIAGILGILYYFADQFKLIPSSVGLSQISLSGAFFIGLVASVSTCMATTGALLASFLDRTKTSGKRATQVTALFTLGRLASYAVMGFVLGSASQLFAATTQLGGIITLVTAAVLIVVGLDMLRIISLGEILSHLPGRNLVGKAHSTSSLQPRRYGLFLGALSYLLPCGFTLSTQAYAISTGSAILSAGIMLAFALGTVPSLFAISLMSQIRSKSFYQYFVRVVGIIVIAVGASYLINIASLYGLNPLNNSNTNSASELAPLVAGKQEVSMTADAGGYFPSSFTVRRGIPVLWKVDGKNVLGCQGTIQSPGAGIALTNLKQGENTFEFTPQSAGTISFSCSMGMFTGNFTVVDSVL